MLYFQIPYEIQTVVKKESSLTGKSIRQIVLEKLRGETVDKVFSPELKANLKKLDEISFLKKNWNGNHAKPICKKIIKKSKILVIDLDKQPQIFPTANDSIQIEYDGINNSYLEFQITKKNVMSYYMVDKNGSEKTGNIDYSSSAVNKLVGAFYG